MGTNHIRETKEIKYVKTNKIYKNPKKKNSKREESKKKIDYKSHTKIKKIKKKIDYKRIKIPNYSIFS